MQSRVNKQFFTWALIGALALGPTPAQANYCRGFLTGFSNLIFRAVPENEPRPVALGILTPHEPGPWRWYHVVGAPVLVPFYALDATLQAIPHAITRRLSRDGRAYSVTPMYFLMYTGLTIPTRRITERITGRQYDLRGWVRFVLGLGGSILLYDRVISPGIDAGLEQIVSEEIGGNPEQWDALIEWDIRYVDIKLALQRGLVTRQEARVLAFKLNRNLRAYYGARQDDEHHEAAEEIAGSVLGPFLTLRAFRERGVPRDTTRYRYLPTFSSNLSEDQLDTLRDLAHLRYAAWQVITVIVRNPAEIESSPADSRVRELSQEIQSDPFAVFLQQVRENGDISGDQLISLLQEDMERRVAQLENRVIGRVPIDSNGVEITLEDYRRVAVDEMRNRFLQSPQRNQVAPNSTNAPNSR